MLTAVEFKNYRAFSKGKFEIRPLTIFVGANSVGKTSLLQLLLLLKQTAAIADKDYLSAIKIHGRDVSIGDPKNFFFNRNTQDPFEISLSFDSGTLSTYLRKRYYKEFKDYIIGLVNILYSSLRQNSRRYNQFQSFFTAFKNRSDSDFSDAEMSEITTFISQTFAELSTLPVEKRPMIVSPFRSFNYPSSLSRRALVQYERTLDSPNTSLDLKRTNSYLREVSNSVRGNKFVFSAKIYLKEEGLDANYLRIKEFSFGHVIDGQDHLHEKTRDILRFTVDDDSVSRISSDYFAERELGTIKIDALGFLNPKSTLFNIIQAREYGFEKHILPQIFFPVLSTAQDECASLFYSTRLGHIGPLRAYPKRFYLLDIAHSGATDGDLLVETLRENTDLRQKVNAWMARLGIDLRVTLLEQIIYKLAVSNVGFSFELDITDVGFGISQLLPILVEGFASPPGKTIMIEQPEIHLHPKMQSDLADLFIDIAGISNTEKDGEGYRRNLIIETHSEYLLSRLRRRIAEGYIKHSDVALYIVSKGPDGSGSVIKSAHIPENGGFEWPEDFFADDLEDTLAFLQSAASNASRDTHKK